jgi:hypothetical protein
MYRHYLVSSFGLFFAARLWARHILDRFRDAVAVTAPCHTPLYSDPDREEIRDFNLGRYLGLAAHNTAVRALPESACFL